MLHKRILAAATATFLALGMAVGGASPAMANGNPENTCNGAGYEKPAELDNLDNNPSGEETYEWGSISWDSPDVTITVDEGYVAELCIKGGNDGLVTSGDIVGPDSWTTTHTSDLSHLGFTWDVVEEPGLATADIDVTDPNCFSGALLNIEGFEYENATYDITYDGADFTVIFTADEGYEFADGMTTKTFTGTLADALEGDECTLGLAQAWLEFTAATCLDPEVVETPGETQVENAVLLDYTVNDDGTFEFIFGLADGGDAFDTNQTDFVFGDYEKDVSASYNDDFTELTISGTLAMANDELCEDELTTTTDPTQVNTCDVQSYTITASEGVVYTVSINGGEPTVVDFDGESEITVDVATFDTVVIEASLLDGYAFEENTETEWTFEFPFIEECIPTLGTASVAFDWTPASCLARQNVTVNSTLTSNAVLVGQPVFADGALTFVFDANEGDQFNADEPPVFAPVAGAPTAVSTLSDDNTRLTVEVAVAPIVTANCDLETLAITGASNAIGGLGMVAVLIMMAGTGLVVARRREAARIQG